jgi:hypothetical protein
MEKGSSTGEEMGRGPGAVRQRRASDGCGQRSAADEAEQGAPRKGSDWERKQGRRSHCQAGPRPLYHVAR